MKLHKRQPSSPILNPLSNENFYLDKTSVLGKDSWNNYKEEDTHELNNLSISTVKAIFLLEKKESGTYYVVSHKKARNNDPRKDNKFEFPGENSKKKKTFSQDYLEKQSKKITL